MIALSWPEIVALELGLLDGDGIEITRITSDSRAAGPGDLFVALNTGTQHVADARSRGAATLLPHDQHAALAALASLVRSKSGADVVAVVGSTGKTSTKDILGALCAAVVPTVWAEASQNNEIGLPLTVCRLESDTRVLVTEMGMRGLGQIADLCAIARPSLALVTSIGPEHLELLGSVENVARANAEAIEALPPGAVAVVPSTADAPELEPFLARPDIDLRRFDRGSVSLDGARASFELVNAVVTLDLPFAQRHMAENTLAALTAYEALGLPLDEERLQEGVSAVRLSHWRGEELELRGGGVVVNDAYNANPASMRAALLHLDQVVAEGRRRVAILGEMAELGDGAEAYHREIGALVAERVDVLIAIGPLARGYMEPGVASMRWLAAPDGFDDLLEPGDAVLVKASRSVGLEGIPARIEKLSRAWSEY